MWLNFATLRAVFHSQQILLDADEKKVVFAHADDALRTKLPRFDTGQPSSAYIAVNCRCYGVGAVIVVIGTDDDNVTWGCGFVVTVDELCSSPPGDRCC